MKLYFMLKTIEKILKILSRPTKSFIWVICTIIFGLLQLWLVWGATLFLNEIFPFKEFIMGGALLFFTAAILASVAIDYLLSKKTSNFTRLEAALFIAFPLIMLGVIVFLFSISYDKDIKELDFELLCTTEIIILIITFIYSFFVNISKY